jgi:hypothetical protein
MHKNKSPSSTTQINHGLYSDFLDSKAVTLLPASVGETVVSCLAH